MAVSFRAILRLAWVLLLAASCLRVLDAVPRAITGLPRGVERLASAEALEAVSRRQFALPSFYPSFLEWPPRDFTWDGRSAAVSVRRRDDGTPWLILASSPRSGGGRPAAILPAAAVLQESDGAIAGLPARIQRLQDRNGAIWHQAVWDSDGLLLTARCRGSVEDLVRIASSLRTGRQP